MSKISNLAIITAAGLGLRMDANIPKQLLKLAGKHLLIYSIDTFAKHGGFKNIIVTHTPGYLKEFKNILSKWPEINLVEGGKTRQESVFKALKYASNKYKNIGKVLIHDAARPFVSGKLIDNVLYNLTSHDAVDVGLAINDTIKQIEKNGIKTQDRGKFYLTQTPQGFSNFSELLAEHQKQEGKEFTDDISLYLASSKDREVIRIPGEEQNYKLTNREDLLKAEYLMKAEYYKQPSKHKNKIVVGFGIDVHAFKKPNILKKMQENIQSIVGQPKEFIPFEIALGGIKVLSNHEIIAHSDGDVVLHALTDAMLGALSLGDIGQHFPPNDPKWRNCPSSHFIKYAKKLCESHKAEVIHVDITIICESPKISPYRQKMRECIATMLDISINDVSIKATTTEQLGFLGRKEGIAAMATCTIQKHYGETKNE